MKKSASANYPIHDLIRERWSPRSFTEEIPSKDKILSLFEAARWAPSCYNDQPWFFLVAIKNNHESFRKMLSCLAEQNSIWAQKAPILIIALARTTFSLNGKTNRHAYHDVGMAIQNIALQATALGLAAHPMAGFSSSRVKELYNVPADFDPITAIAVGFPGSPDALPEELRQKELETRYRKSLQDFVFVDEWGKSIS
ncbi:MULTISPECIES: nitroreductase family protein [Aminobacterium]|jgi:nitroreductase|uniref:nitroreductase family protein n=2 Tax=Aminobacterium TaxID=81466 RepID=UPI000464F033|nr:MULTISPECIES: nitroreductase family protein [Aminobacterium]